MKLTRISNKPIFTANPPNEWEAAAVFNCAAVYENGLYHMVYRATDIGGHKQYGRYVSSLGYAVSKDLREWHRLNEPILKNDVPQERRGPEDPRIVKIDASFYMTYTGFGDRFPGDYRICLATSKDLVNWHRRGALLDEENKNSAFFPVKFGDEYLLLHRRKPDIWISSTRDMQSYYDHTKIMATRPEHEWESVRIGIAGPPVDHPEGWLLFYHAVDSDNNYRLGVSLLDKDNPRKVLARHNKPVIEPELSWEKEGWVPNVIFSCATIDRKDRYEIIYGGADKAIGAAYIKKKDIKFEKGDWLV